MGWTTVAFLPTVPGWLVLAGITAGWPNLAECALAGPGPVPFRGQLDLLHELVNFPALPVGRAGNFHAPAVHVTIDGHHPLPVPQVLEPAVASLGELEVSVQA